MPIFVPTVRPYLYPSYTLTHICRTLVLVDIVSTPVANTHFCKAPNQYQKVRIVRYVRKAIDVLLLPFEYSCLRLAVSFSKCSFITACPFSISNGIFRLCKTDNPCLLSLQEKLHGNCSLFSRRGILS